MSVLCTDLSLLRIMSRHDWLQVYLLLIGYKFVLVLGPDSVFWSILWKNTYPTFKWVRRLSLCVQMLCRWCTSSPPGGRSGRSRRCPWKPVPPSFTRTWPESLSRPHPPSKPCWSCSRLVVRIWASLVRSCCIKGIVHRAAWLIACDIHAHLVSKAGSVISSKSPSHAFRWSSIYYTEP